MKPRSIVRLAAFLMALAAAPPAPAQWNPANAQWGKSDPMDIRVMTWNVQDALTSTNFKGSATQRSNWNACARIVAALKPDILILQETADNSGNGTGSGVDSIADAETTFDLFLNGGNDPFRGGTVGSYVKLFDPNVDLPHVFVSTETDGFNRNVILSRFPFIDLNGDGIAKNSDLYPQLSDLWSPSGDGGIRGFMWAEIDLPDDVYAGDLAMGNGHLKAFGDSNSMAQRIAAAQNIAYHIDFMYNGAGTGMPDPNGRVFDSPPVTELLGPDTPAIWGGDFNEDEDTNGRKGPAQWMIDAELAGGSDGTDRDRSDSTFDTALEFFTGNRSTQSSSKLDYIAWQDSIVSIRRQHVFNSASVPGSSTPPELIGYPLSPGLASSDASDHRPVFVDFILPAAAPPCPADLDGSGTIDATDLALLLGGWGGPGPADLDGSGTIDAADLALLLGAWGPC